MPKQARPNRKTQSKKQSKTKPKKQSKKPINKPSKKQPKKPISKPSKKQSKKSAKLESAKVVKTKAGFVVVIGRERSQPFSDRSQSKAKTKELQAAIKKRISLARTTGIPVAKPETIREKSAGASKVSNVHRFVKTKHIGGKYSGGGKVTFRLSAKSFAANQKEAVKILNHYKNAIGIWQVAKAWKYRGNKYVGYSPSQKRTMRSNRHVNDMVIMTALNVQRRVTGRDFEYKVTNISSAITPAPFEDRGSKFEFELIIYFTGDSEQSFQSIL